MSRPIALFDSGLGGLTVLSELRRALPHEQFIYLGDTARTPYGTKSPETVQRYALECARFLLQFEIKALVVACNTASALALQELRNEVPVPVIGAVEPAVRQAIRVSESGRVLVLATNGTIASGVYEKTFAENAPKIKVLSKACPLFVPLVENGLLSGSIVEQVVELYLSEINFSDIDTIVLGCTHYPFLRNVIQNYVGGHIKLVDSAVPIAGELSTLLRIPPATQMATPKPVQYFVTDEVSRFNYLASALLEGEVVQAAIALGK